jgi:glucose-1-phosphate cytidylyltransferase
LGARIKTIILAGGLGTRISEETADKPKPMVLIGNKPILWHVMSIYAQQGFTDFLIAGGYKYEVIEQWTRSINSDWTIEVINTGESDQTGSRIKKSIEYIGTEEPIFLTYGDGLGNVDLKKLLDFHVKMGRVATVTAVRPPARFGVLESSNGLVTHFGEKNQADSGWINGGFFVLEPKAFKSPISEDTAFESDILPKLVNQRQLSAYYHEGFWQPMDTLREKLILTELATRNPIPWIANLSN